MFILIFGKMPNDAVVEVQNENLNKSRKGLCRALSYCEKKSQGQLPAQIDQPACKRNKGHIKVNLTHRIIPGVLTQRCGP